MNAEGKKDMPEWAAWSAETHLGVGGLVLGLLMEACDLVEKRVTKKAKNRVEVMLVPTDACIKWVLSHNEAMEIASPDRMPCIVPPEDWTGLRQGGYYSPILRSRTALVKMRASRTGQVQNALYEAADLSQVMSAVNALQRTPWQINAPVFAAMRAVWHRNLGIGMPASQPIEVPVSPLAADEDPRPMADDDPRKMAFNRWKGEARELHTLERERIAKNLSLMRTMRMANSMQHYNQFWYVYQCDFRGRVYSATAGLSPQGTDQSKALIRFANGKRLGERGLYWLKVHGANKYGTDKVDYDDRVAWIDSHSEHWIAAALDPVAGREYWQDADKPYQFLAFCIEYEQAVRLGEDFVSHLPVALDGSCNGLQHFSAMLRDAVGGAAVNLTPSPKPADIYQDVGDVCTRKLMGLRSLPDERHGGAANWMALFHSQGLTTMPRKLPKPPVMTMPYGSTRQACTTTIFKWVHETAPAFFEKGSSFSHAMYLSPLMWDSIGEVVVAARLAMDWIQNCASILSKAGHPLQYTSPIGFPVYQATYGFDTRKIETQIGGRLSLRLAEDTDELSTRKQRQGSSPNLIHHVDATHMHMVLNAGVAAGLDSFAMIHDDFGTHACDIDVWHGIIRSTFVQLHEQHDVLADFKQVHEERHGVQLPSLPPRGSLDLRGVLASDFFFG
jgi:DNA-directed RNA polymerase